MIRTQQPIADSVANDTDYLFRNRWRSLLSVDDIMRAMVNILQQYHALENTYIITTSDHGFNLGQLRQPSCKLQPYNHDIRVPFHIYGPNINSNTSFDFVSGMMDIALTAISLAGGSLLETVDGKSFAELILGKGKDAEKIEWSDKHMLEFWSLGYVLRDGHYIDMPIKTHSLVHVC